MKLNDLFEKLLRGAEEPSEARSAEAGSSVRDLTIEEVYLVSGGLEVNAS